MATGSAAPAPLTDESIRNLLTRYFDACNAADVEAVAACFVPGAVHYFPPGMYEGPFRGSVVIGQRWAQAVRDFGSIWTVDKVITDPAQGVAVMEWSHFKTSLGKLLRGDEWYEFDRPTGLIREIRAYYASPQATDLTTLELGGFDYAGRGYPTEPPFTRTNA